MYTEARVDKNRTVNHHKLEKPRNCMHVLCYENKTNKGNMWIFPFFFELVKINRNGLRMVYYLINIVYKADTNADDLLQVFINQGKQPESSLLHEQFEVTSLRSADFQYKIILAIKSLAFKVRAILNTCIT